MFIIVAHCVVISITLKESKENLIQGEKGKTHFFTKISGENFQNFCNMYIRSSHGDKEMKITRSQLRALIKEEFKRVLKEADDAPKRNISKCVAANEKYAQEHFGRGLTDEERRKTEKACKEDDVVSWYDDETEGYAGDK